MSPIGYDQRSSPVRASRARTRASCQTYTVPSCSTGPASGDSKSVWQPEISHSFCPPEASHAWTPPPRVPVITVPRSALREYTQASVDSRHRSPPSRASRANRVGPSEAWIRPSATAIDQATSRVLKRRRLVATSRACTSKEVT